MENTSQVLKGIGLAVLRFGIGYTVFFYLAHFTEIQSVVLTAVALCALDGYRRAVKVAGKQPAFEPFWVRIQPNWYSICHDFDLADDEKWKTLQETCKLAEPPNSVFRDGLNFTMLSQRLFYSDDTHTFLGELDFRIPIDELKPQADKFGFAIGPRLYIKRSSAGENKKVPVIELGLITHESLKKSQHPADHEAEMPLARLPEIVFHGYLHPDDYDSDTMKQIQERTKAQLAEFSWTEKERDPEFSWLNLPTADSDDVDQSFRS